MKLRPHYHSDLMDLVIKLQQHLPQVLTQEQSVLLSSLKDSIARAGVRAQATGGHFYSPIVDPNTIAPYYMRRWQARQNRNAVGYVNIDKMIPFWDVLVPYMKSYPFVSKQTSGHRYFLDNNYFGLSDASVLIGILKHFRPSKYFEIGSGFSSALALDVAQNAYWPMEFRFVEPYPEVRLNELVSDIDRQKLHIEQCFVQEIPLQWFRELTQNDILFIDSTHVAKSGSDVIYIYTEILAALRAGVLIHIHDIFYPFEYPPHWVLEHNKSWNEAYMLHAFLQGNDDFEVLFFNDAFALHERERIERSYPAFIGSKGGAGGSIWLRKVR